MSDQFPYPFNDSRQGTVDANGDLVIDFGPGPNIMWEVTQVSYEMLTAPAGATCTINYQGSMVAPGFSARKAAISGEPPLFLRGGERASVVWANCTSGDIGKVLLIYHKHSY